ETLGYNIQVPRMPATQQTVPTVERSRKTAPTSRRSNPISISSHGIGRPCRVSLVIYRCVLHDGNLVPLGELATCLRADEVELPPLLLQSRCRCLLGEADVSERSRSLLQQECGVAELVRVQTTDLSRVQLRNTSAATDH